MPDNDLISRAAALNALLMSKNYRDAHDALEQLPTVDAAPVVRCKDCRYYNGIKCERRDIGGYRLGHWYCADGERADAHTCGTKLDGGELNDT